MQQSLFNKTYNITMANYSSTHTAQAQPINVHGICLILKLVARALTVIQFGRSHFVNKKFIPCI